MLPEALQPVWLCCTPVALLQFCCGCAATSGHAALLRSCCCWPSLQLCCNYADAEGTAVFMLMHVAICSYAMHLCCSALLSCRLCKSSRQSTRIVSCSCNRELTQSRFNTYCRSLLTCCGPACTFVNVSARLDGHGVCLMACKLSAGRLHVQPCYSGRPHPRPCRLCQRAHLPAC